MRDIIIKVDDDSIAGLRPFAFNAIMNYEAAITPTTPMGKHNGISLEIGDTNGDMYNIYLYHTSNCIIAKCNKVIKF